MNNEKARLRAIVRARLRIMSKQSLAHKSLLVRQHLIRYMQDRKLLKPWVGAFYPMAVEPQIAEGLLDSHSIFAYPTFEKLGVMSFAKCDFQNLRLTNNFGREIGEPSALCELVVPSVCFVPGLAFSKLGERLGRGGGYYDRYLRNFNGLKIGVCFSEQLEEKIETERHDQKVDVIISDSGVIEV